MATPVTLIQDANGKVIAVKINNGPQIPVDNAGPAVRVGKLNLVMEISDISVTFQPASA